MEARDNAACAAVLSKPLPRGAAFVCALIFCPAPIGPGLDVKAALLRFRREPCLTSITFANWSASLASGSRISETVRAALRGDPPHASRPDRRGLVPDQVVRRRTRRPRKRDRGPGVGRVNAREPLFGDRRSLIGCPAKAGGDPGHRSCGHEGDTPFHDPHPAGEPAWPHEPLEEPLGRGLVLRAHAWHQVTPEPAGQNLRPAKTLARLLTERA